MIRLFVFSLLAIIVALWVTLYLGFPSDPGYLLIAFGNYTFETSLFALLVASGILYLLFKLLIILLQWINPRKVFQFGQALSDQRKANARSDTIEGLLYFTRGNWLSSYNLLTKSADDKDASVVNYLAAAYAAHKVGRKDDWIKCLEEAEEKYPKARSTINSLKAQLLFKSGQLEQSVAVLEQLKRSSVNDPSLMHLLKEVYVKLQDWQALKELLPVLEKNKVIDTLEIEQIQMRIFMEELYASCSSKDDSSNQESLALLNKLWRKAPAKYREDEKVVKHYSELLIKLDSKADAAKAIETAVSKNWSETLVQCYGELDFGTSPQQLIVAEGWLKARPADANLMLSLGRISMRNELWGKAKEYYEASIKIAPTAEAYGELSRLLKHLGEVEASETYLQSYGDMIGAQLPELPLPAQNKITH
ncbi:MAG: hypothetical protein GKR91_15505 [Pseudomonadales bacterium]|nr:hypothetical protein [Pseudomonadales bacterium]